MDELESLGSSLGGGLSASSSATATSGGNVTANTDFNFGSGTIDDAPQISAQSFASASSAAAPAQTSPELQPGQPVYTQPVATVATAIPSTVSTILSGNKPLLIGGALVALIAIYIILKK